MSAPVEASTQLYEHTLVFVNSSGYFDDDTASGVNRFAGIAVTNFDNSSGAAAAISGEVFADGEWLLTGSGFAAGDVGKPAYGADNYTISLTGAGNSLVGRIKEYVSSTKVWVAIEPATDGPTVGGTYTQTYSTASRTVPAATASAVATTGATNSSPYGFTGAAQADALVAAVNANEVDILNVKKVVTAIIDDLQAAGIVI
jgi:hypothetical protein